jgi:hypothetical protein
VIVDLAVYTKTGQKLASFPLSTIFQTQVRENAFVLYDPYSDRFVIGANTLLFRQGETSSYDAKVLFTMSKGDNPIRDGWYSYVLPLDNDILEPNLLNPNQLTLGSWHNGIYMTLFVYGKDDGTDDGFIRLAIIDRETVMVGKPLLGLYQDIANEKYMFGGIPYYPINTMSPTVSVTLPPVCENAYFIDICASTRGKQKGLIVFHECVINWHAFSGHTIRIKIYPPNYIIGYDYVQQKGTDVEILTGSFSLTGYQRQARYSNIDCKSSYWLSSVSLDKPGIIWFQVRIHNGRTPKIVQQAIISHVGGLKRFAPDMAINKSGNVVLVATQSSSDTFPSVVYYYRFATDQPNLMTSEKLLIEGTGSNVDAVFSGLPPHTKLTEWGFNTVQVDPSDTTTFFVCGEWYKQSVKGDWYSTICNIKL